MTSCTTRRSIGRAAALVAVGFLIAVSPIGAQAGRPAGADTASGAASAPIATLSSWADEVWWALLDRDGSYSGRLAEEGTFQRFHRQMDDEYELDVATGLFTPGEDARWAQVRNGLRVGGASISHPHILHVLDWRQENRIGGPVDLIARYRRERSLTARRDYPSIGIRWREVFGSAWALRAGLGVHFFKPSADVELALSRSWTQGNRRRWDLEVRIAALDAFNNAIFGGLGVSADEVDAHYRYEAVPLAGRAVLSASSSAWRAELHAGASRLTEVRVTFPALTRPSFGQRERVRFAGGLFEVAPHARFAAAAYAAWAQAETDRTASDGGPTAFSLRERTATAGARARAAVSDAWAVELDGRSTWRPERRALEDGDRLEHNDRDLFTQAAVARRPAAGWTASVGYAWEDRDTGWLAPHLTARNQRLTTQGGYRFTSGAEVTAGLRWDTDNFGRAPFDGGHLRFVAVW